MHIVTNLYAIAIDPARNSLRIRSERGFWQLEDIDRVFVDIIAAVQRLPRTGAVLTLVDLTDAVLQTGKVIARLQQIMRDSTHGRIALVAPTALARMQSKRLQVRDGIRLFSTLGEGEAWLFGESAAAAAAA